VRKRWLILAVLAGCATGAVPWLWPDGPRWHSGSDAGKVHEFSPDGQVLVTYLVPRQDTTGHPSPIVSRWDAATGQLLSRATMACADPAKLKLVWPSADGRLALVGEGSPPPNTGRADFGTGDWYLHDGITGDRRLGPIPGVAMAYRNAFSLDGRWFQACREPFTGRLEDPQDSAIFSVATGDALVELAERDNLTATCHFAPDGSSATVAWWPKKTRPVETTPTVEIIELPSGKLRRRCELPQRMWSWVIRWDGKSLELMRELPADSQGRVASRSCVFDLTQDAIGAGVENPLLTVYQIPAEGAHYWQTGDGWLAFFTIHRTPPTQPWYRKAREWLQARLGVGFFDKEHRYLSAKFVDPATGAFRYEVPRLLQPTCLVSPDGRLLAADMGDSAIEVWQIPPTPRWPIALVGGLGVATAIALFGRYRGNFHKPLL
jgi:hypothetical protein